MFFVWIYNVRVGLFGCLEVIPPSELKTEYWDKINLKPTETSSKTIKNCSGRVVGFSFILLSPTLYGLLNILIASCVWITTFRF